MNRARWIVAKRELVERARSRAFQVGTAIQLVVVIAVLAVTALASGGSDRHDVGLVGAASQPYAEALRAAGPALDAEIATRALPDRAAAVRALDDGDLDAAVLDGRVILVHGDPDDALTAALQATRRQLALRDALERAGVPPGELRAALAPPALRVEAVDPAQHDRGTRQGIAFIVVLLLYLAIFTYGLWVAGGIVEEKSSRVIEVVLSAIPPRELLIGKIVGLGLLGLATFAATIALGAGGAALLDAIELPHATAGWTVLVTLWFLLGYALYSCVYAVAGALVSRQEDLQSTTGALNMVVIAAYIVSFIGIQDPGGNLMTVASFLPPSAPMAMPARWLLTDVPAWQLVLSLLLTVGAVAALLRLAATVYARAALRTGPKVSLRSVLAARDA